jgi:hypothetical protein
MVKMEFSVDHGLPPALPAYQAELHELLECPQTLKITPVVVQVQRPIMYEVGDPLYDS